ncbi:autotransporter outer membrane beta-barrel domain-containing protein [Bartonella massiliensis]|uniref:autotransporter outer membrane beta-barrel domain-containing protein n=1 Tax=Bartonella massiliensis TaxID=929795 RepID=UPI001157B280|nr:autotransporter outer membrane beta-barrel domain-containing protein [Bartonella massiliensis]
MINVFKKRTHLYALTTSIFFFSLQLQGANAIARSIGDSSGQGMNGINPVPVGSSVDGVNFDLSGFFSSMKKSVSGTQGQPVSGTQKKIIGVLAKDHQLVFANKIKVSNSLIGAAAVSHSVIILTDSSIITPVLGLYSDKSDILMASGIVSLGDSGIGVMLGNNASVILNQVKIKTTERENAQEENAQDVNDVNNGGGEIKNIGFLTLGGIVSFNHGTYTCGGHCSALWVSKDNPLSSSFNLASSDSNSFNSRSSKTERSKIRESLVGEEDKLWANVAATISSMQPIINEKYNHPWKISASMHRSTITMKEKNSYGIVFKNIIGDDAERDQSQSRGARVVFLQNTQINVEKGVGIYGEDLNGYVILKEGSRIAGDLFLKATSASEVSVFSQQSTIVGGARIYDNAAAKFYLSDNSQWLLSKSKFFPSENKPSSSENVGCDSCISSINLKDSSIKFMRPQAEQDYKTLYIGRNNGTVYSATGESGIYFNVLVLPVVSDNNVNDNSVSDKLFIHGNVSGQTKVYVNAFVSRDSGQNNNSIIENSNKFQSISLIQVSGEAQQDSFILANDYVTLGRLPYQYKLRAYNKDGIWYFCLEDKDYMKNGEPDSSVLEKDKNTVETRKPISSPANLGRSEISGDGELTPVPLLDPTSGASDEISVSSSRNNSSVNLGRSDTGDVSVTNVLAPLESVATDNVTLNSSAKNEISTKPDAVSAAVGRILLLSHSDNGSVSSEKTLSSTCDTTQNNGEKESQTSYSCSDGKTYTVKDRTLKANSDTEHSMHAKNKDTVIKLENVTINGADASDLKNGTGLAESKLVSAVLAEEGAEVILDKDSTITSSVIGLEAKNGGKITMSKGKVDAYHVGALADSGSSVNLKGTTINVTGDFAAAGLESKAGKITMDSGTVSTTGGVAVKSKSGGGVQLDKVHITVKKEKGKLDSTSIDGAAFMLSGNSSVDFKNGNVVTDGHALVIRANDSDAAETGSSRRKRSSDARPTMNHANIESSTVKVEGDGTYGIYFDGQGVGKQNRSGNLEAVERSSVVKRSAESKQEKTPISITGTVSLKKTKFEVAKGVAIYGNTSVGLVSLKDKTNLSGDLLLKAENDSNILVSVNDSTMIGGAHIDKSSYVSLILTNGSEWILKRSKHKDWRTLNSECVDSCVSSVSLINSAINFKSSESEGKYQTLYIGNGKGTVYEAQGNAIIHLNARLNPHDPSDQQVTDRLVIHGDVSGKTKIHVRGDAGSIGNAKANAKVAHSVSIIQVYGQAKKDSFQLDGDYVALIDSPYKYTLRAYGPGVTSKQEHVQQKFVRDGGAFWNFRLENQYVKSVGSASLSEQFVRSVVPQVPTYLVLPNSIFHAGLMDINNQNKQLETLRMTPKGMVDVRENPALYLRGYGGSFRYASDLSALEYGYGSDLNYHGVEAGVLLQTIENADSAISLGVMGTYGKLSLQPLNVEQSQKSAFDKWTAIAYGSMQHDVGFYVDGLLSYGLLKGDVLTLARGKTATLKGNPLSVSLMSGQTITTGYKGFVFDPQVQVVYQHLQFNKARDIDNFDIEMGNLDQWVARVGGRLTKNPAGSEGVDAVAFYGKLYLAHGLGGKQSVHFSDAFKLGAFGSSLEAGLGFNAKLLPQFSLHADVLYQHKLNKAGFSGASFSGGVRYQF